MPPCETRLLDLNYNIIGNFNLDSILTLRYFVLELGTFFLEHFLFLIGNMN